MGNQFRKDPQAILDYQIDWSSWLQGGDTISASTWTVPSGLTRTNDVFTSTTTTVWLSGGTAGQRYEVINHVTTAGGREDDRTIYISVVNR